MNSGELLFTSLFTSSATDAATKCLTSVSLSGGGKGGVGDSGGVESLFRRTIVSLQEELPRSAALACASGEAKEKCCSDVLVRHILNLSSSTVFICA